MARSSSSKYTIALNDTLSQETCKKDGKEVTSHFVVVKNTPFLINISSKDPSISFRKTKLTASLLYDCEPRREVTLIKSSPLEYVTHLSSNADLITIEARIHVLTSQNENSLFRVNLKFNDEDLFCEPIKVISKADNLKKPNKSSSSSSNKRKRSAGDAFEDTLHRIEQQQMEQKNLLDMLYQQNKLLMSQLQSPPSPLHSVPSTPIIHTPSTIHSVPSPSSPELPISSPSSPSSSSSSSELQDCISSFRTFLNSYKSLRTSDRPDKIRLMQEILVTEDPDTFCSFSADFLNTPSTPSSSCGDSLALPASMFDTSSPLSFDPAMSPEHDGTSSDHEAPSAMLGNWLDLI